MSTEAGRITALIDGDISGLKTALGQARSEATRAVSGIEGSFKGSLGSGLQSSISGMTASMGPLGSAIDGVAGSLGMAGMATVGAVAGLAMVGSAAVSTAANWESLMASVSKTTGVEGSGLDQLSNDLQQIRMETGATAEGIASAVTTAGSIGIPTGELASFTEVAMQMGSAFGMSAEAASEAMGKIGNVVKPAEMSWTEFSTKAGSAVNDLADSMATSEAEILTGMKHLGATMALLKPPADTIPAWTAMVATVQSLGLAGDQAGEAIQDALQYATKDLKGGISGLLGMTKEELQINLRTNAPEVMQEAAAAIAALPLEQQGEALASFGQTGQKAIALLMGDLDPASGKFEKLGDAIDTANKGWEEGASLASAYGKSQETFNASIDRLYASLDVAGQKLGTVFLPLLADGIDLLTSGVQAAIGFGSAVSELFSSDLGGIFGTNKEDMYQDIVDKKRAAEAGKEIGDEVGKGVAESDDLKAAPGEALGSPEAMAAVAKSSEELAKEAVAAWKENFVGEIFGEAGNLGDKVIGEANIGGGLFTTVDYDINNDFGNYRLNTPTGEIKYSSLADMKANVADDVAEYVGRELSEIETAEILGDTQAVIKLKAKTDVEIDIADVYFTSPEQIASTMEDLIASAKSALSDTKVTQDERMDYLGLMQDLENLERLYPAKAAELGTDALDALKDALKREDFAGALAILAKDAGKQAGDEIGEAMGDAIYGKLADGSGRFFGDFMTAAKSWTDYVIPEGGYAGPTEYYDEYYAAQAGQQIRAMEALQNVEDIRVGLSVDVEAAKAQLQAFYESQKADEGKSELEKTLDIDDEQAKTDVAAIDTAITTEQIKPISLSGVDYAFSQIAAIDAAASAPITKMIYLQTVGGASGGSYNDMAIPRLAAGDIFVSRPTLAVVGDRPGGEWVGGLDQAKARFGGGHGGNNKTVNVNVYVQGSVTGEDLINTIVDQAKAAIAYDLSKEKF